jgi:hypothetical protein
MPGKNKLRKNSFLFGLYITVEILAPRGMMHAEWTHNIVRLQGSLLHNRFLPWKNLEAVDDSSSCEKRPVFRSNDPPHTILDDSKRALERRMVLVVRRVPMRRDYAASPSVYRRVRRGFWRTVNVMPCPTGQESSTRGSPISKMNAGAGGQGKQLR